MNPEQIRKTIEAIINGFSPLAQKLQVPVSKLFEWAIRQNYVYLISYFVYFILFLVFIYPTYRIGKWLFKKNKDETRMVDKIEENGYAFFVFIIFTIMVGVELAFIAYVVNSIDIIVARIINPEYMALKDLLESIKIIVK